MNGYVDPSGRVLVPLRVAAPDADEFVQFDAWIDTGFDGHLVLPMMIVQQLGLTQTACVAARLGDGNEVLLDVFACEVDWFGDAISLDVIANQGEVPLIGFGQLANHRLTIDYPNRTVSVE